MAHVAQLEQQDPASTQPSISISSPGQYPADSQAQAHEFVSCNTTYNNNFDPFGLPDAINNAIGEYGDRGELYDHTEDCLDPALSTTAEQCQGNMLPTF